MSGAGTPPFHADHVGSLLRPEGLLHARSEHAAGRITDTGLRALEDEAVAAVVRTQEGLGLQSATDGEFRREYWHLDFILQLEGVGLADDTMTVRFVNESGVTEWNTQALQITGKVGLRHPIFADDFRFLKAAATTATPKLTMPSPSMVHYRRSRRLIDEVTYPDLDEFYSDLSAAYADQVRALGELGCTYLQLDDTSLAYLNDPRQRAQVAEQGWDAEHQHERYIRTINQALAGRPAGMHVTTHLCRGNYRSSWAAEGGYDYVAEALFGDLAVDGFFLEYDDARSGGFEPLRYVPKGKRVVLGLVTTKRGELESKDLLKRRIDEASKYVPLDQLCLSPQCGFSSTVQGNALTYDEQLAKISLIVETAAEIWG